MKPKKSKVEIVLIVASIIVSLSVIGSFITGLGWLGDKLVSVINAGETVESQEARFDLKGFEALNLR